MIGYSWYVKKQNNTMMTDINPSLLIIYGLNKKVMNVANNITNNDGTSKLA